MCIGPLFLLVLSEVYKIGNGIRNPEIVTPQDRDTEECVTERRINSEQNLVLSLNR
jgi:hypothetical protein